VAVTRLASFNVENMFDRPKAMSRDAALQAPNVLAAHARVNELIGRTVYDTATKAELLEHLTVLGLLRSDDSEYAMLRKIRGRFLTRPSAGGWSKRSRTRRIFGTKSGSVEAFDVVVVCQETPPV